MLHTRSITCVYLVLCLILLAGCAGSQQTVDPFEDGATYIIRDKLQLRHENISIGTGAFQKESCVDNPKKKCLTADLWVVEYDHTNMHSPERVQTGQTITVGQYTILIVEVDQDQESGWIEISIKSSGTPSPVSSPDITL